MTAKQLPAPRPTGLSRRRFLKASLTAGGALVAATLPHSGMLLPSAASDWTRSAAAAGLDGTARGLAQLGRRTVAVGRSPDGSAAAWVRDADGAWRDAGPVPVFADADVMAVAALGRRFVAVGSVVESLIVGSAVTAAGRELPVVERRTSPACWSSPDGTSWSRAALAGATGYARLLSVAAGPSAAVAVGAALDGEGADAGVPLVARTSDGGSWSVQPAEGIAGLAEGELSSIAYHAGGWWAASVSLSGSALWSSADGLGWTPVATPTAVAGPVALRLEGSADTLTAIGAGVLDPEPRMWTSRDGARTWRAEAVPPALRAGRGEPVVVNALTALVEPGGTVVAVAHRRQQPVLAEIEQG